ncbi:MAG: T9SS type A sorting domain-containing protein [Bacteroidetes bacterium]|nr:T9SS type A sorting domain-containing protein [Bacteroidota bacterium]
MKTQLLIASLVLSTIANAQYTKLLDFAGATNGTEPHGDLISDGTYLYGMTFWGGANNKGVIFKIMPDGIGYSPLFDFTGTPNGSAPYGSLIFDGGFLYGMAAYGGTNGFGTIFKVSGGTTKLHDFGSGVDGRRPFGSLVSAAGFFYGTTSEGGSNSQGTIFTIMPNGTNYNRICNFSGIATGSRPTGSLIYDGTFLYGMTSIGGTFSLGTIFKIKPDGSGYSKLHDFVGNGNPDGGIPQGSLISDGTFLYGMTTVGGTYGLGTIFKIKPDGTGYTKLLDFAGAANGSKPAGSLIYAGGFLYGMTSQGGTNNLGTLFKIKPDGTGYSKRLDFSGVANGGVPLGSLIYDGTFLYGMTSQGGTNNLGTIFKYNPLCLAVTFFQSSTVCAGQSVIVGTNTYSTSGTYHDTLISSLGCDSIVTTNVTVLSVTAITNSLTITTPTCGNNNGSVTAATGGGASPYIYFWSSGDTTATVTGLTGSPTQTLIVTITDANNCTLSDTAIVQCVTGVTNYDLQNQFIIYPNPNNGTFQIQVGNGQLAVGNQYSLEICNVLGEKILFQNIQSEKSEIYLGKQPNGIYFLQVKSENETTTRKLIIQK